VLGVRATREKAVAIKVFGEVFGKVVCAGIQAVSMDSWEG
jgi:hypothetical protein